MKHRNNNYKRCTVKCLSREKKINNTSQLDSCVNARQNSYSFSSCISVLSKSFLKSEIVDTQSSSSSPSSQLFWGQPVVTFVLNFHLTWSPTSFLHTTAILTSFSFLNRIQTPLFWRSFSPHYSSYVNFYYVSYCYWFVFPQNMSKPSQSTIHYFSHYC